MTSFTPLFDLFWCHYENPSLNIISKSISSFINRWEHDVLDHLSKPGVGLDLKGAISGDVIEHVLDCQATIRRLEGVVKLLECRVTTLDIDFLLDPIDSKVIR